MIFSSFGQAKGLLLTVESRYQVNLWDIKDQTHKIIMPNVLDEPYNPYHVSIDTECEKFIVTLNHTDRRDSTRVLIYNCESAKKEEEIEVPGHVVGLYSSRLAFSVPKDKGSPLTVTDLQTKKSRSCEVPLTTVMRVFPSPDGKKVVMLGDEGLVCLNLADRIEKEWHTIVSKIGFQLLISPDGKVLAHQRGTHTYLHDMATGKETTMLRVCWPVCFTPSGRELITFTSGGSRGAFQAYPIEQPPAAEVPDEWDVITFDPRKWKPAIHHFNTNVNAYQDKDGLKLLAGGQSGEIRIWPLNLKREVKKVSGKR